MTKKSCSPDECSDIRDGVDIRDVVRVAPDVAALIRLQEILNDALIRLKNEVI
jgi:hypothetical protein